MHLNKSKLVSTSFHYYVCMNLNRMSLCFFKDMFQFQSPVEEIVLCWNWEQFQEMENKIAYNSSTPEDNPLQCRLWLGPTMSKGYGRINAYVKRKIPSTNLLIHRLVFFMNNPKFIGLGEGMHISHISCWLPSKCILIHCKNIHTYNKWCILGEYH